MTVILEQRPRVDYALWPLTDTMILGAMPNTVRLARTFTVQNLHLWGMSDLAENASLVTSELVTNAIKATWPLYRGVVAVWLWANGHDLLIEVWDASPEVPQSMLAAPDGEAGRGLAIVASLCQRWGYYTERVGKVVWAML